MKAKVLFIVIVMVTALTGTSFSQFDWGDAPDPPYPTFAGAFHGILSGMQMGVLIDSEVSGQPDIWALGDDLANQDDDDGVIFNSWIIAGQNASVTIIASWPGMIDAWIDFNGNGSWMDAGDQIFLACPVFPGPNNLTFPVPASIASGIFSFARIRYSTPGVPNPFTFAPDGEVEDYQLWLGPPPIGDVSIDPDPSKAFTQNEISLACITDPNFGPTPLIVAAYNDEPFPGGPGIGVSYSTDAGVSWNNTHMTVPMDPFAGVPFIDVFDPTVCIDDSGHVFVGHIATDNNWGAGPTSGLYVHKSTDGGISWQPPVQVDADNAPVIIPPSTNDPFYRLNDRCQIATDNYPTSLYHNNIYITWIKDRGWNMSSPMSDIYFSRSSDGGNSFSSTLKINFLPSDSLANMPTLDVAKDGTVYVAWMDYNVITGGQGIIFLDKSFNGGATFGADIPVDTVNLPPINLNGLADARAKGAAVVKVMPSNPNELYIVFAEDPDGPLPDEADIFLIKSTNGGSTWTAPVRVNDDATTTDQVLPWMDIKPNGIIDIAWYDRRNDPGGDLMWDVYFTSSTDGGNTFTPNTQINNASFSTPTPGKVFKPWMGEYMGLAADYNDAHIVYTSSVFDFNGDVFFAKASNPGFGLDWGDAPDPTYPTLAINNGARHVTDRVTYLGTSYDVEPDGMPSISAAGDDLNRTDDEDGVKIPVLRRGNTANLLITASVGGAYLNAWFDFNADGDWMDNGEYVIQAVQLAAGGNILPLTIPSSAITDTTYARFRFSTTSGLNFNGLANDGEVEDYRIVIWDPVPSDSSVNGVTIGSGQSECYNATDTVLVAETAPVVVQNGGSAIFIAGNVVLFKPGFHGQWGSYVDGHITMAGNYCENPSGAFMVTNPIDVEEVPEESELFSKESSDILLYPNPNTGQFTIDVGKEEYSAVIRVMNYQGARLYQKQFMNQRRIELDLSNQPSGIYIVVIQMEGDLVTRKVVKN